MRKYIQWDQARSQFVVRLGREQGRMFIGRYKDMKSAVKERNYALRQFGAKIPD